MIKRVIIYFNSVNMERNSEILFIMIHKLVFSSPRILLIKPSHQTLHLDGFIRSIRYSRFS